MRKNKKQEEHENHERWLVSYADFITLLFAFFVVMYSVSSVNEGKYRVLSESIDAAFKSSSRTVQPIQVGEITRDPRQTPVNPRTAIVQIGLANMPPPRFSEPLENTKQKKDSQTKSATTPQARSMETVTKELSDAMAPLIKQGVVDVSQKENWIEIAINSSILFPSGSAQLARQAIPLLENITKILVPLRSSIHVEGFTDNIPISSLAFPSNWELSAARAASVVHLMTKVGIDPKRLAAVAYGEYQPVSSNDTVDGRQKNRRVVLIVNALPNPRFLKQAVKENVLDKALEKPKISISVRKAEKNKPQQGAAIITTPKKLGPPENVEKRRDTGVHKIIDNPIELPQLPETLIR